MTTTSARNKIVPVEVWREIEQFDPNVVSTLLSTAVSMRSPEGHASLVNAAEAGVATPDGFDQAAAGSVKILADRLFTIVRYAMSGGDVAVQLLERWVQTIASVSEEQSACKVRDVLDASLRVWLSGQKKDGTCLPPPSILRILQRFGACIERPRRDEKGKSVEASVLARVLEKDAVEILEAWYGDQRFSAANPLPDIYPPNSYKRVGALAAALAADEPLPRCTTWFLSRLESGYRTPLEEAFAVGIQALDGAQGKARDRAVRIMARIIGSGGVPAPGKAGATAKWQALFSRTCGAEDMLFPAAVIHEDVLAEAPMKRMLATGLLDVDNAVDGTLLHHAVLAGRKHVVDLLLEHGASLSIPYRFAEGNDGLYRTPSLVGRTAADLAAAFGHAELAALIRSAAARREIEAVTRRRAAIGASRLQST